MKTSMRPTGSQPTANAPPVDPLAFLEDLAWTPKSGPPAAAAMSTSSAPGSIDKPRSTSPQRGDASLKSASAPVASLSPSPKSPSPAASTMETQIARQAQALAELDARLRKIMETTRGVSLVVDQSTTRLQQDLHQHRKALLAVISSTEASVATAHQKTRQRLSRVLRWAVLMPIAATVLLCTAAAIATWAWTREQIDQADAAVTEASEQLQQIQNRTASIAANARRHP